MMRPALLVVLLCTVTGCVSDYTLGSLGLIASPEKTPANAARLYERLRPRLVADPACDVLVNLSEVSLSSLGFDIIVTVQQSQWAEFSEARRRDVLRVVGQHMRAALYDVQPTQPRSVFSATVRSDTGRLRGWVTVGGVNERGGDGISVQTTGA